jgi:hypothetical protein
MMAMDDEQFAELVNCPSVPIYRPGFIIYHSFPRKKKQTTEHSACSPHAPPEPSSYGINERCLNPRSNISMHVKFFQYGKKGMPGFVVTQRTDGRKLRAQLDQLSRRVSGPATVEEWNPSPSQKRVGPPPPPSSCSSKGSGRATRALEWRGFKGGSQTPKSKPRTIHCEPPPPEHCHLAAGWVRMVSARCW